MLTRRDIKTSSPHTGRSLCNVYQPFKVATFLCASRIKGHKLVTRESALACRHAFLACTVF